MAVAAPSSPRRFFSSSRAISAASASCVIWMKTSWSVGIDRPYDVTPSSFDVASSAVKSPANCGAAFCGSAIASSSAFVSDSTDAPATWPCTSLSSASSPPPAPCVRPSVRWKLCPAWRLSDTDEPMHWRRPLWRIAMRSPSVSASSRKWVVSTSARPCFAFAIASHTCRRDAGSIPAVGSSSSTNFGSPISAHASESFRFWPPLSVLPRACCFSSPRPTFSSIFSTAPDPRYDSGIPLHAPTSLTDSAHVSETKRRSCCGQTPEMARMASIPPLPTLWP